MQILKAKMPDTNVSEAERWLSLVGGSSLVAYGLARRNTAGFGLAALGGSLLWRGMTGHCPMYETLGVNTAERGYAKGTGSRAGVPYELGIRVDHEIHVNKPIDDVYAFWRELGNLSRFMDHLECVKVINDRLSHWTAKGPIGMNVEWDAEIINDIPNTLIGWRSLEGSDVDNGGSVRFEPRDGGTVVKISMQYNPPAGQLGEWIASMFGNNPRKTIAEDLERFKELMETGNVTARVPARKRSAVSPNARYYGSTSGKQWERDTVTKSSEESFPASDPPSWTPEAL